MNYPIRIGIVGGGQLGKMLTQAAKKLGFYVTVIDPTPQSPAGQVADKQIVADFKDPKAIKKLAKYSDFITFEIELTNDKALFDLMKKGKIVNPTPSTLAIIRDKLKQKEFLQNNKIPTAEFMEISYNPRHSGPLRHSVSEASLSRISLNGWDSGVASLPRMTEEKIRKFGYPLMLKAREDAYDGRGNFLVKKRVGIKKGLEKLKGKKLYIEKFVPFVKELAVMVARSTKGELKSYPVAETIHKDNICDTVIVPARVSLTIQKMAKKLAERTVSKLKGAGVFGIEMFLTSGNKLLVNEIAPRVHNSGHYSIEASVTSQFEQHIRAISGLPLGSTDLIP